MSLAEKSVLICLTVDPNLRPMSCFTLGAILDYDNGVSLSLLSSTEVPCCQEAANDKSCRRTSTPEMMMWTGAPSPWTLTMSTCSCRVSPFSNHYNISLLYFCRIFKDKCWHFLYLLLRLRLWLLLSTYCFNKMMLYSKNIEAKLGKGSLVLLNVKPVIGTVTI